MDTDQDGINDAEDDFPLDRNETTDTDGDGVSDTYDYYPEDAARSEQDTEDGGGGLVYAILALLALCGLGALLVVRKSQESVVESSPFATQNYTDTATDTHMGTEASKELPVIAEEEPQQWEEAGVNWSKAADGSLSYYDTASSSWVPYEG